MFSTSEKAKKMQFVAGRLSIIVLKFGSEMHIQFVDIPMGTNCAPLVAGSFMFCYMS